MISDARGGHVSPGIYTEERDVAYAVKSLGITSLGVVGETLIGPAFQPVEIADWNEFLTYFGGTSTEKFKDTDFPKYELPYIAKSYLEQSKRLNVVRVLGLSGYKAGPVFTVKDTNTSKVVAVLRSKMVYGFPQTSGCTDTTEECLQIVQKVEVGPYREVVYNADCAAVTPSDPQNVPYKFSITVTTTNNAQGFGYDKEYFYNVSLIPSDPDYIYNVLGTDPNHSNTPVYVEAVFENNVDDDTVFEIVDATGRFDYKASTTTIYYKLSTTQIVNGQTTADPRTYTYKYVEVAGDSIPSNAQIVNATEDNGAFVNSAVRFANVDSEPNNTSVCVYAGNPDNTYRPTYLYRKYTDLTIADYYDNYKEMYRPAQTPWFVSNIDANDGKCTMHKLFKFVTISDGNASNYQVKISIQNIDPSNGTFDVLVRDYNDSDAFPKVIEKFTRCNLVEGTANYIANKIGTPDGSYPVKSKFITVKMADNVDMANAVPAGFLGYPMPTYSKDNAGTDTIRPTVEYNTLYDITMKPKRQYFGMASNMLDADVLSYKGYYTYDSYGDVDPTMITNGFHMDSILSADTNYTSATTYVDGVSGYVFTCVSPEKVGSETKIPRIINKASYLHDTIYADASVRKFTCYFYGGFDGWDENRYSRTNTDDYKATRYNVAPAGTYSGVTSTSGMVFHSVVDNGLNMALNLPDTAITSDYYAYLAGYRAFANPQEVDINVFATPGIDWYNNRLLVEDAIDIVEDMEDGRGGDALYIVTTPRDLDYVDAIYELDETGIDTSYAATYYPWVSYFDKAENRYIDLPVTKDVVRNLALTDNTSAPWFASAGVTRGKVDCYRPLHKTTLTEEDALYENRMNPVKFFAKDGVLIWGNKTMYTGDTPLNRINVRRLMIRIKKLVIDASRSLIFEQADEMVEKQFRGIVDPILANVKSNRGIYDYRIITENTEETRDQHILPAKILVKPTPTLEYISISFVVYPESVKFDE